MGVKALPSWLTFDAATQTFSGKAPKNTKGTLDITVTASDGHGAQSTASDTFRITFDKNGLKGNEAVGNGGTSGNGGNQNDCFSPGYWGSQGNHCDDDDDQGHGKQNGHGDDCDDDARRGCGFAYLDLGKVDLCWRDIDKENHGQGCEGDDFYKRWAEMDRTLGQLLAEDKGAGWFDPKYGIDLSCLKGIGLAGGDVKLGAGGCDNLSLIVSDTLLKGFKGLQEGIFKL